MVGLFRVGIQTYILNLVRIGRSMCPRTQYTDLPTMGGTAPSGPIKIIFGRLFRVGIQTYILNLVRIKRSMCPRTQYADLPTMGGTGPCGPMWIIFGRVI